MIVVLLVFLLKKWPAMLIASKNINKNDARSEFASKNANLT